MVVDAPTSIIVKRLAAPGPPGVGPRSWPGECSHHIAPTGVDPAIQVGYLLIKDTGSLVVKIYKRYIIFGEQDNGAFQKIFPEDMFYEDNAISNTWMLRVKHFEYIAEPLYYYYQHAESTVHTISEKNLQDRITAGRMLLTQARTYGYLETYRLEIEFMYTVLFYINTLFSAMPKASNIHKCYKFCRDLGKEMKETFPAFQDNPYYQQRIHPEEKKLIAMHMHSHLKVYGSYRLLWFYRGLRKK